LEGLILKLKLQYFGHLMCRVNSLEKTLIGKEMATYSSILAWKIPRTEEPGGLQSVRYNLANKQQQIIMGNLGLGRNVT